MVVAHGVRRCASPDGVVLALQEWGNPARPEIPLINAFGYEGRFLLAYHVGKLT